MEQTSSTCGLNSANLLLTALVVEIKAFSRTRQGPHRAGRRRPKDAPMRTGITAPFDHGRRELPDGTLAWLDEHGLGP